MSAAERSSTTVGVVFSLLIGVGLLGVGLHAQTFDAGPFSQQHVADVVSTVILAGTMSTDVIAHVKRGHDAGRTWQAVACTAGKYGSFDLASIGLDAAFPRWRPDHSDTQDGFSKHTGQAVLAIATDTHSGWLFVGTLTAAVLVIVLRGDADKHDVVGRLEGLAGGAAVHYGITRIPACQGVS